MNWGLLLAWVLLMVFLYIFVAMTHEHKYKRGLPQNWTQIRKRVIERAGFRCEKCGRQSAYFHIDHITPRSKGGSNDLSNLRCLCPMCHAKRHPYNRKLQGLARKQT